MISIKKILQGIIQKSSGSQFNSDFPPISFWSSKLLKHQTSKGIRHYNCGNCKLFYRSPYTLLHLYPSLYEQQIYRFEAESSDPLIIDCGANIGLSVVYFKWLYPHSRVYAFEPDKDNLEVLEKNVIGNNFEQVTIMDSAVWIHNDGLNFFADGSLGSRISDKGNYRVNSTRLADFLNQFDNVDFLKIDIEGAEFEVLCDLAKSGQLAKIKNMFLEYHGDYTEANKLMEIMTILQEHFDLNISNALEILTQPFIRKSAKYGFDVQLNIYCLEKITS